MTRPSTGVDWNTGGFGDTDSRFFIRGGRQAVCIRQNRGTLTDMSPANFTPFAQDGQLRNDLFAQVYMGGYWVTNPNPNLGFWLLGAFKEGTGPTEDPKLDKDDYMIEQSNRPYDTDIVKEDNMIKVTPVETLRPFLKRVRRNLPLLDNSGNIIVEDPGQTDVFWGTPVDTDFVDWQLLTLHARRKGGKDLVVARGFPLCKLVDKGTSKMDKKESDASDLSFEPVPDGLMVDLAGRPIIDGEWVAGDGWTALGGVPVLSATPPVATPTTTGKATIAFADPTGTGDPWTYAVEKSVDAGATWTAAVKDDPGSTSSTGGTTTIKVKSLAAGATLLRAKVTGTNGATATTPSSNSITVT
jgi:hypothetical protein